MYTKVVEAKGESLLVFFARTDIKPVQELTYDYRSACAALSPSVAFQHVTAMRCNQSNHRPVPCIRAYAHGIRQNHSTRRSAIAAS